MFGAKIVKALIVVALGGEDTEIFVWEANNCSTTGKSLKRLKFFVEKAA
ncbi:hypothetical protein [Microcoleus vaginatus]